MNRASGASSLRAHRLPPSPHASTASWLRWVNETPTFEAIGLECLDIASDGAEFVLDATGGVSLPLETDGSVMHALLMAAADIVAGASAVRAAPEGFISVTGSLFTQLHGRAYLPVRLETSVCPGSRGIQTVGVVAHGGTGTALTMSLTMVLIPADQRAGRGRLVGSAMHDVGTVVRSESRDTVDSICPGE